MVSRVIRPPFDELSSLRLDLLYFSAQYQSSLKGIYLFKAMVRKPLLQQGPDFLAAGFFPKISLAVCRSCATRVKLQARYSKILTALSSKRLHRH